MAAKTEEGGDQGDDGEGKTEELTDDTATSAKATKKVCFQFLAVLTHVVLYLNIGD